MLEMEENTTAKRTVLAITLPDGVLQRFKEIVRHEGESMPMLFVQFMANYVRFMDKSFLCPFSQEILEQKKRPISFVVRQELCNDFSSKIKLEQVKKSHLFTQFVINYVNFMDSRPKKVPEKCEMESR